jgi:hypothetical protein
VNGETSRRVARLALATHTALSYSPESEVPETQQQQNNNNNTTTTEQQQQHCERHTASTGNSRCMASL